jgi:hypothetical protein
MIAKQMYSEKSRAAVYYLISMSRSETGVGFPRIDIRARAFRIHPSFKEMYSYFLPAASPILDSIVFLCLNQSSHADGVVTVIHNGSSTRSSNSGASPGLFLLLRIFKVGRQL